MIIRLENDAQAGLACTFSISRLKNECRRCLKLKEAFRCEVDSRLL